MQQHPSAQLMTFDCGDQLLLPVWGGGQKQQKEEVFSSQSKLSFFDQNQNYQSASRLGMTINQGKASAGVMSITASSSPEPLSVGGVDHRFSLISQELKAFSSSPVIISLCIL